MAEQVDVSPELYEKINNDFKASVAGDKNLRKLVNKIRAGAATQQDVAKYSTILGRYSSKALKNTLKFDILPNSTLYWNIAEKTIGVLLLGNYASINRMATQQLSAADKAMNLGIQVVAGRNPAVRISQVMNFACNSVTQEELDNALTDPVIAANRKFFDDFQRANGEIRTEMGLEQIVVRTYDGVGLHDGKEPCQWCIEREGTWDYQDAISNGVFERHPGCGCDIEVISKRGVNRQINWRNNEWEES